mmetsp:Transcript_54195/g.65381  ORF Transcript_54195/g.65381 Transcript_54195/m.65381 type:complete len:124 (-) Transcript_54195:197-568(-)|eukprot:CAMPEP_0172512180 /NCGR_PEP_ID=MMETSP1066-20121228/242245_1 /TAXON_ID=671091 /ORGANISM="Coscinodiscus wailesii, Strain CCMP2513" /LENGTH=123 /DNA_ID=CAMNT_0013291859 /DNA_START=81 /DNA_END=452 /DNA_ORIENTATION=+
MSPLLLLILLPLIQAYNIPPPPPVTFAPPQSTLSQVPLTSTSFTPSALTDGIKSWTYSETAQPATLQFGGSSEIISLKERPPPPTAEELAAKKRNFNFWFWGGGFVAPFLATIYYFGLRFWER